MGNNTLLGVLLCLLCSGVLCVQHTGTSTLDASATLRMRLGRAGRQQQQQGSLQMATTRICGNRMCPHEQGVCCQNGVYCCKSGFSCGTKAGVAACFSPDHQLAADELLDHMRFRQTEADRAGLNLDADLGLDLDAASPAAGAAGAAGAAAPADDGMPSAAAVPQPVPEEEQDAERADMGRMRFQQVDPSSSAAQPRFPRGPLPGSHSLSDLSTAARPHTEDGLSEVDHLIAQSEQAGGEEDNSSGPRSIVILKNANSLYRGPPRPGNPGAILPDKTPSQEEEEIERDIDNAEGHEHEQAGGSGSSQPRDFSSSDRSQSQSSGNSDSDTGGDSDSSADEASSDESGSGRSDEDGSDSKSDKESEADESGSGSGSDDSQEGSDSQSSEDASESGDDSGSSSDSGSDDSAQSA